MDYYVLLEKLIGAFSVSPDLELNLELIYSVLKKLCVVFRVSKGVTTFYDNSEQERMKDGDVFVCELNDNCSDTVVSKRVANASGGAATCDIYLEKGAEEWSELELERIELIQSLILGFMSNNRMRRITEVLAYRDYAGFPNLRYYLRELEKRYSTENDYEDAAFCYNITHFSRINQQVGRVAGDGVLKRYYDMVLDAVEPDGILCRMGGDNFSGICKKENLPKVEALLDHANVVYDINTGETVRIFSTAGIFEMPKGFICVDSGDIMEKLTCSFQAAKSGGGSRIVHYSDSMLKAKAHVMWVQSQFAIALKHKEFHVCYQPKVCVITGKLKGAEALCRWFHNGRIIQPLEFIPSLEQNMDICKLDFFMLENVCADIRRWLDEGQNVVPISVNFSRKHLLDYDLEDRILEIIDRHNVPHEFIEIELTETTTDVEFNDLKRVAKALQKSGVSISVDDFGIGYSSLNLLREVPWNVLKVDKSFLPTDEDNENSTRDIMFRYTVGLAKRLGLECVAEGVETRKQLEILRQTGCDFAQGFYFDHALPVEEFEEKLESPLYDIPEF